MIKHVVMWRMKAQDPEQKKQDMENIRKALLALLKKVPSLHSIQVGVNENSLNVAYDLCLITKHHNWEGLKAYQEHPNHQSVAGMIGGLTEEKAVADFVFEEFFKEESVH